VLIIRTDKLCQYNLWQLSLCVGGRVVCRCMSEVKLPICTRHGHRQLQEVVLTQFVCPDDEHDVLETCRDLKI